MEQNTELTAQEVELYLLSHPDYFIGRDRLVKRMVVPHESGTAISLLERQNELLRHRSDNLQKRLDDLISNARTNDRMFQYLQKIVLSALSVKDVTGFRDLLKSNLCEYFEVDAFRLFVSSDADLPADILESESTLLSMQELSRKLTGTGAYCGSLPDDELKALYGTDFNAGSVAIARSRYESTGVSICLGSRNVSYYRNSMDTLFLNYLADVSSRLIHALLDEKSTK